MANQWTKEYHEYNRAIKGEPDDPDLPERCWAITNEYDPRTLKDVPAVIINQSLTLK